VASQDDVRRIALALPEVDEAVDIFAFSVVNKGKAKGFAWVWNERIAPKKPKVANPSVLAVRVPHDSDKADLIAAAPDIYFTEPHYNGFPAILVRLGNIDTAELTEILTDAWRCQAPKALVDQFDSNERR
jgi:hypothetical protein